MFHKNEPIGLPLQKFYLEQVYGDLIESCTIKKRTLTCYINLKPSDESIVYQIKIQYRLKDYFPQVWLLSPSLEMWNDEYPHHLLESDREGHPQLCVFDPDQNEWNWHMNIATSFVTWIVSWLNAYEYWLITGEWHYAERILHRTEKNNHDRYR